MIRSPPLQVSGMPRRDYIDFQDRSDPIGYLITFRCYGTWLHGDERGSVDRHHRRYGTPGLPPSTLRQDRDRGLLKRPPVKLNSLQRPIAEGAIRETCEVRRWRLWTVNVRTNHVHAVVSADKKPAAVRSALKANATRRCAKLGCGRAISAHGNSAAARNVSGARSNWRTQ